MKNVIIAVAAFAAGAAAGWFASGVGKERPCNETMDAPVVKPRASDVGRRTSASIPTARAQSRRTAAESQRKAPSEQAGEKPKEAVGENAVSKGANNDNPFPRYLDMFRNNPEALAAEFEKEAAADRAEQRQMRDEIIRDWKLNEEDASFLEKALDDLREEVRGLNEEFVGLIASGQLDEESSEDGSIMCSNHLLSQKKGDAVRTAFRETAEKLYRQLVPQGVSAADEQVILWNAVRHTAYSYDSFEPFLQVYDKVYKNMGFGKGIFSWCSRPASRK